MRSITFKLILSFLGISLVSVLAIVLFARYTTDREFRRFTTNNDRSNLMGTLQDYYVTHGSWNGIEHAELFTRYPAPMNNNSPFRPYGVMAVTDQSGKVIRAGANYKVGDTVPRNEIQHGADIQ